MKRCTEICHEITTELLTETQLDHFIEDTSIIMMVLILMQHLCGRQNAHRRQPGLQEPQRAGFSGIHAGICSEGTGPV